MSSKENKMVYATIPIHTHFNTPDINGHIFDKDSFLDAFCSETFQLIVKQYGGFPITKSLKAGETLQDNISIKPEDIIGYTEEIDPENMTVKCKFFSADVLKGIKPSIGIKALCELDNEVGNKAFIKRILSLELIDITDNPCE